ncbi:hypothetical protein [Pseudooceanicola sp.]
MQPNPPVTGGFYQRLSKTHPGTADLLKDLGQTAVKSATLPWLAKIQGEATKNFNDAAYPGTSVMDQMGANSAGPMLDAANKSDEMRQREKESRRASSTALQTARIGAGERVAGLLLANNPQNAPQAIKILAATGGFPPEFGFDPKSLVNGKLEAELGVLNAQKDELGSRSDLNKTGQIKHLTEAQRTTVETELAPARHALDVWKNVYGKWATGDVIRGLDAIMSDAMSKGINYDGLIDQMVRHVAKSAGEGEAWNFRREMKKLTDEAADRYKSDDKQ